MINFYKIRSYSGAAEGLNVLFFGTDTFSLATLKALENIKSSSTKISSLALVHGGSVRFIKGKFDVPPVLDFAKVHNIPYLSWSQYTKQQKLLRDEYDLAVVASFGHFMPSRILSQFTRGAVNVHPSLLPRWRGPAPIVHTILAGDEYSGVSMIEISPRKFDEGRILMQRSIKVHKMIDNIETVRDDAKTQDSKLITHAPKITKQSGFIKYEDHSCIYVNRLQRALPEKIGIRTYWDSQQIKFGPIVKTMEDVPKNEIGICQYHKGEQLLTLQLKDGILYFDRIQVGIKPMVSSTDFYNGYMSDKNNKGRKVQFHSYINKAS